MKIHQLQLFTADLESILQFYGTSLELPTRMMPDAAVVSIGTTEVLFAKDPAAKPYHFAINIPSHQEEEALAWLASRVDILPYQGDLIVDFPGWNARAVYFYDPAKNIVELIARRNLSLSRELPFTSDSLLSVSEIGIAPDSIDEAYQTLHAACGLEIFDGGLERFCAVGDEHGLFIAVDRKHKSWMPTDDPIFASPLELIMVANEETWRVVFDGQRVNCHPNNSIS